MTGEVMLMGLRDWFKRRGGVEDAVRAIEREDTAIKGLVTKEEQQLLKLDEEIQAEFDTLRVALATAKQYFRTHNYTPTQVLTVTNSLRKLKMKFDKVAESATKAKTRPMLTLAAYAAQVSQGLATLITAINTKTIQFGGAPPRAIEGVNDIIDHLEQTVRNASVRVDSVIKEKYAFLESYEAAKRAA
jgi:hypothetical protein